MKLTRKQRISQKTKDRVVSEYLKGLTYPTIATLNHISEISVYRIVKSAQEPEQSK